MVEKFVACSLSTLAYTSSSIGTWNVRGIMSQDRITLDQLKVTQLLLSATRNNLGVLALTEVHCRALRLEGHARDTFGDTWSYHLSGDLAGGCTGTGFLVSPKLKVLDYRVVSPRLYY